MSIKITKEEINQIIELSKTKSQKEIAEIYNRTQSGIGLILKRNGAVKQKKSRLNMSHLALNVDYFEKIDSSDKAYWLGFICADGDIKKTNNKTSLISKDLVVIEGFKRAINSEHAISKRTIFDKRTSLTYTGYSIQITNELFTRHLINLGVTSNKTDVLGFPDIEEKYYSYFIAGLFDGDGSISWKGKYKNRLTVSLISSKEILDYVRQYLSTKLNIEPKYYCKVTNNKSNVWKMYLYSDAYKFLSFIYSDDNFQYYLKRKYVMFVENIGKRKHIRHIRKINQFDEDMNHIKTWNNQKEIVKYYMCSESNLNKYLRHGNKSGLFINYIWKYEED